MKTALQLADHDALVRAAEHLASLGYDTRIVPFEDVDLAEHQDWMTPANGGYVMYLPEEGFDDAMNALGTFFGCTD